MIIKIGFKSKAVSRAKIKFTLNESNVRLKISTEE